MSLPGGAQLINTHEDLLSAFTNIDQRLHRIIGGNDPPYIWRNKLYLPCSMYAIPIAAIGSAGSRHALGSGGELPGQESAHSDINTIKGDQASSKGYLGYLAAGSPLSNTAGGTWLGYASSSAWNPILPVTVTADGAGNPPATVIVDAVAAKQLDIMLWWTVDTVAGAGQYQHNFAEDPLGTPAACIPDWTAITIPVAANETQPGTPYGERILTTTDNKQFGVANGANGDWPNGAKVTYRGFYRTI